MPIGRHENAVIAFCHEGSGSVHLHGTHRIQPGSLVLVPGWSPHRVLPATSHLSYTTFKETDLPLRLRPALTAVRLGAAPTLSVKRWSNDLEELLSLFPQPEAPSWAHEALRLVYQHVQHPWSLGQLAHHLGISPPHLTTQMRRLTGRSLMQWSLGARLEQAALQLTFPRQTVSEVAQATGFTDLCHFRRCFRRRYGVGPAEYRTREQLLGTAPAKETTP